MLPLTAGSRQRAMYEHWITTVRPPVVKFCRQAFEPALAFWTRAQGSKIVGRWVDYALTTSGAENGRLASRVLAELLPFAAHLDYVEFANEEMQGKDDPGDWDTLMEACVDFMQKLDAANRAAGRAGPKACIANVSVGQPELDRWTRETALFAARYAAANGHVWGIHEYYKPDPWAMIEGGKAAWDGSPPARGWLLLRCTQVRDIMRAAGIAGFRFIITESGRDNVPGQPGEGGGFRDVPGEPFAERMAEYGRHLSALPECVGWVDFGYNAWQGWKQFDLTEDEAMHERVVQSQARLPRGVPAPAPVPVPSPSPAPSPPPPGGIMVVDKPSQHHSSRGGQSVRWIIVHSTDSPATSTPDGTGRYLQQNDRQVSVHEYVAGATEVWRMVADDRAAHHCESASARFPDGTATSLANEVTWGIEGFQRSGQAVDERIVEAMAQRVAEACRRLRLGADRVLAHREIDPGRRGDPVGVDMDAFRARVAGILGGGAALDRAGLLTEAAQRQAIRLNPSAAIQRVITAAGFVPTSGEFDWSDASGHYVAQRAESLATGEVRVYYAKKGDWGRVMHVAA